MHIHICHGAHATTGLVLAGDKSAVPGRVFSPLSETDATGTQRFVGNTECEGFLGSVKLRQAIACKVREHKIYFSRAQRFVGNIRFVRNALRLGGFFLRFQKPTQPARNGSSESLRVCVRLEGFLGSVKLTHACRFDLLKQDCQLRGI